MRTIELSEESFKTLLWLVSAYLCGDLKTESYDTEEDDRKAVQLLEKEILK